MRRFAWLLAVLFLSLPGRASGLRGAVRETVPEHVPERVQTPDSLQLAVLDEKLDAFFLALENESVAAKNEEADFLIGSCTTQEIRDHVAVRIYYHYMRSKRMGDEGVAVHLTDRWFATGEAHFVDEIDLMNARIFAEFNRASLLEEKAPALNVRTPDGGTADIPACSAGRISVLYIYDTQCAKCRLETMQLRAAFREKDVPVDFIAFYAGDDGEDWEQYREGQLAFAAPSVRMIHVWDPELDSDFQRKYGVLQTPRMFLLDRDGVIIGRGLDTPGLMRLLEGLFPRIEYGSEASERLFDEIFGALGPAVSEEDVQAVGERIEAMTLARGDTLLYKQMAGDLLLYLSGRRGEGIRNGAAWVTDRLILGRPALWTAREDSLQVLGLAGLMQDLLGRTPVGSRLPAVRVPGTLVTARRSRSVRRSLRRIGGSPSYVFFFTQGCEVCRAEKEAVSARLAAEPDARFFLIDFDRLSSERPALADRLLETFDLSVLPFLLRTDRKGRVLRKYISLQQ